MSSSSVPLEKERPFEIPEPPEVDPVPYLHRLWLYTEQLTSTEHVTGTLESADSYIEHISQQLIRACDLNVISLDVDHLPAFMVDPVDNTLPLSEYGDDDEDDDKEEKEEIRPYQRRRTDYLRILLRAMAPVSMDIAAHVSSYCRHTAQTTGMDRDESVVLPLSQAALVLFSVWLPLAPHIMPMARSVFATLPCPLTKSTQPPLQRWFLAEAAGKLTDFYCQRQERQQLLQWDWSWSIVHGWMREARLQKDNHDCDDDDAMQVDCPVRFSLQDATIWHAVRVIANVFNFSHANRIDYFKRFEMDEELTCPWCMHPWDLDQEEYEFQRLIIRGKVQVWEDEFPVPDAIVMRRYIQRLHPDLVEMGGGLVFRKQRIMVENSSNNRGPRGLVQTKTTTNNMALLAATISMQNGPPILLIGPQGSGKSSLVREMARRMFEDDDDILLEIHVDEETDTKTLVGSYTATEVPGEFEWRPGALTRAVRAGKWVLLEDLDRVPAEIQASLVQLFKDRLLPLGNGKVERCHFNFRLFATLTTADASMAPSKRILHPTYWAHVPVQPLSTTELQEIALAKYANVPGNVVEASLQFFRAMNDESKSVWVGSRKHATVRDWFKVLSRIQHHMFEHTSDVAYTTESQRTLCLAECVDVFLSSASDRSARDTFIQTIAAPIWGITAELALSYLTRRRPEVQIHPTCIEVGRARILSTKAVEITKKTSEFAQTNHALRIMESVAVCIQQNEPTLLVGETGCGKTTMLQQMAKLSGRELVVQNLSLQTDSTDLLGGFRPLEINVTARKQYQNFVDLFTGSFSRRQNATFLEFCARAYKDQDWKKLSQCFRRAAKLGGGKALERSNAAQMKAWERFAEEAESFERQRLACSSGLAFAFTEGALVDAITRGKWILLDEINLASSETLQRLCGLLDDATSSITLTERGDSASIERSADFRLFAAMNPATDAGKKDLPPSIRSRFTEIFVDELLDPVELRVVASRYLGTVLPAGDRPPEHTEIIIKVVELYLRCRELADTSLVDGSGQKPRYSLRTLTRAITTARNFILHQNLPIMRALREGLELVFQGPLDRASTRVVHKLLNTGLGNQSAKESDQPGRRPGGADEYVLVKPFWIEAGPLTTSDWALSTDDMGLSTFILTPTTVLNLRRLARAIASGPWPILLEGPTSAGKTTMIEYMAARCGHSVIRINNHEHTDVQEYTGTFTTDVNGALAFQDGLLVRALRTGHWVILDELNLAPSEVLEALNRLLDDNRELFLPETNEIVKPHPHFRLFATQNPSGAYGGRKPLSRAFRNRFVELHIDDIPSVEMVSILEKRCACPPSHAKLLVSVMDGLRQRRSRSGVFLGKDGYVTPRDVIRWAQRKGSSKSDLANEGYMLLAERLRSEDEKECVREEIELHFKLKVDVESLYYGRDSEAHAILKKLNDEQSDPEIKEFLASIAVTKSLLRLTTLVARCIQQREPVLLVGDTGCGKTTVVQMLSYLLKSNIHIINCHATTESSDLLGGLRPVRGRSELFMRLCTHARNIISRWPSSVTLPSDLIPAFLLEESMEKSFGVDTEGIATLRDERTPEILSFSRKVLEIWSTINKGGAERDKKRRKLDKANQKVNDFDEIDSICSEIEALYIQSKSLFEWNDGPLVQAMKEGAMILLDEMSLAEDAVLERLNSVLEPSRTLVLAEKGGGGPSGDEHNIIKAHDNFRLFATMNPGGDFGKRELSPALRSRFTEVWVPSVSSREDMGLALQRYLSKLSSEDLKETIRELILDYVQWFNFSVCADPANAIADHTLSLRDILTWAKFIVSVTQANNSIGVWQAYVHGASLMHLDGLGLGTGLGNDDAVSVKVQAERFLRNQLGGFEETCAPTPINRFKLLDSSCGMSPFYIAVGPRTAKNVNFELNAPTTAVNASRVLRAMQLQKPVLLEGSPGVGKTSLIAALAAVSGHELVRINLSEQSDITDLMGNDLPVSDSDQSQPSFRWFDGIFLSALKSGSWVLLDELNLAPQSVLEGLNSCLDHRASIYIPELGKSFHCPPSFRVFAAQNPLGQGGGRKGLPKSFLNRFTKVYVDALDRGDYMEVVRAKFPSLPSHLFDWIIDFNCRLNEEVVKNEAFGHLGAPWEFNLRDICRLGECMTAARGMSSLHAIIYDVYVQRFRSAGDRAHVLRLLTKAFGSLSDDATDPKIIITNRSISIGDVQLALQSDCRRVRKDPNWLHPVFCSPWTTTMRALARSLSMKWPSLLVGGSKVGKDAIVGSLAHSCDAPVVEIALSASTDVSELIGCYEQVSDIEYLAEILEVLETTARQAIEKAPDSLAEILSEHLKLIFKLDTTNKGFLDVGYKVLTDMLHSIRAQEILAGELQRVVDVVEKMANDFRKNRQPASSHFVWKDGPLVHAMLKGHWLYLKNVNLCPSSVLDRLNPVMESEGTLVISECSLACDTAHRRIQPNANFRLILSMSPDHGEVSRALRNRCAEICVLDESSTLLSPINHSDRFWKAGLRPHRLVDQILKSSKESKHDGWSRSLDTKAIGSVTTSLINQGSIGLLPSVVTRVHWISHCDSKEVRVEADALIAEGLPHSGSWRHSWNKNANFESLMWETRCLRVHATASIRRAPLLELLPGLHHLFEGIKMETDLRKQLLKSTISDNNANSRFRDHLLADFVLESDSASSATFLNQSMSSLGRALRFLFRVKNSKVFETELFSPQQPSGESSSLDGAVPPVKSTKLLSRFLCQTIQEESWRCWIRSREPYSLDSPCILELSFRQNVLKVEDAVLRCPLTTRLYPFFSVFDQWFQAAMEECSVVATHEVALHLLSARIDLWHVVTSTSPTRACSPICFDVADFAVQWNRMRALTRVAKPLTICSSSFQGVQRRFDGLMVSIDEVLSGYTAGIEFGTSLLGEVLSPLFPRRAIDVSNFDSLTSLYREYSITCSRNAEIMLTLEHLMTTVHPILFTNSQMRSDMLDALCTAIAIACDITVDETTMKGTDSGTLRNAITSQLQNAGSVFQKKVNLLRIAFTEDEERMISSTELDNFVLESDGVGHNFTNTIEGILVAFSKIQIAPFAQKWCEEEEKHLTAELANVLLTIKEGKEPYIVELKKLENRLRTFLDIAIVWTVMDVSDLWSYQILQWVLEADGVGTSRAFDASFLEAILPIMSASVGWHVLANSFQIFSNVERKLSSTLFQVSSVVDPSDNGSNLAAPDVHNTDAAASLLFSMASCYVRPLSTKRGDHQVTVTLENIEIQKVQFENLVKLMNRLPAPQGHASPNNLLQVLVALLEASGTAFDGEENVATFLRQVSSWGPDQFGLFLSSCEQSPHPIIRKLAVPIILPLMRSINDSLCGPIQGEASSYQLAISKVLAGVLQFQLLRPDSPVDPGRKPQAEVARIDRSLSSLGIELTATCFANGLLRGSFSSLNGGIGCLLKDGSSLLAERKEQEKRIIERIDGAHSFADLFREINDASKFLLEPTKLMSMIDALRDTANKSFETKQNLWLQIDQWQRTTDAFYLRIKETYSTFGDVVIPLLDALGKIKAGLLDATRQQILTSDHRDCLFNPDALLCFPMGRLTDGMDELLNRLSIDSHHDREMSNTTMAALLSRMVLYRRSEGIDSTLLSSWTAAFDSLLSTEANRSYPSFLNGSMELSDEDEYRTLFPDHSAELRSLVESPASAIDESDEPSCAIYRSLDSGSSGLLCEMHVRSFNCCESVGERDHLRAFYLGYATVLEAQYNGFLAPYSVSQCSPTSGHTLALLLARDALSRDKTPGTQLLGFSQCLDFHKDPNPYEARKASKPVMQLLGKVFQLLNLFPGNTLLLSVARVAARLKDTDVYTVSLGKLMSGLELILKHAQDWEQHSSERVKIGEPLSRISLLITSWRKLELQNWSNLIQSREAQHARRARSFWVQVLSLLHTVKLRRSSKESSESTVFSPKWIRKGFSKGLHDLFQELPTPTDNEREIIKILDTFILTAPVGQFRARLEILKAFSRQKTEELRFYVLAGSEVCLAYILHALSRYYDQFSPLVESKITSLRSPFEKRLQQEVKLARWDDQTYYSLAETTEKNHRKLMRVLREYDEVLAVPFQETLEAELCFGISQNTEDELVTVIPPLDSFFPLQVDNAKNGLVGQTCLNFELDLVLTANSLHGVSEIDKFVSRMPHYAQKVCRLHKSWIESSKCPEAAGSQESSIICQAIFDRIASLRSGKATRPMKERAFVDLMRELRRHGYESSRWAVPLETKDLISFFATPQVVLHDTISRGPWGDSLREADSYCQRSLAELKALRGELLVKGSRHLTVSNSTAILAFADHAVFMLMQQRCIVAGLLPHRDRLLDYVHSLSLVRSGLPLDQKRVCIFVTEFQKADCIATENLQQFAVLLDHLLINVSLTVDERSSVVGLRSAVESIQLRQGSHETRLLTGWAIIEEVKKRYKSLSAVLDAFRLYTAERKGQDVVPQDAVQLCCSVLEQAIAAGIKCSTAETLPPLVSSGKVQNFASTLSAGVKACLLVAQVLGADANSENKIEGSMWSCHRSASSAWGNADVKQMLSTCFAVCDNLADLSGARDFEGNFFHECCSLASQYAALSSAVMSLLDDRLFEYIKFHRATSKLHYVLLRVFRMLVSKGFCSDEAEAESQQGEESNRNNASVEDDKDGTGMGEGVGARDVTDELENEEQLLGLKGDENGDKPDDKELDREDAEKGMEMEGDFDGEMYDVPQDGEQNTNEDERKEEIDREMTDQRGENEEVLDEKMWDGDDDAAETREEEEKLEKDSAMRGGKKSDEMTTKDQSDETLPEETTSRADKDSGDLDSSEMKTDEKEEINEFGDDQYEENHGVDVREGDAADQETQDDDEDIQLDDDMQIDGESEHYDDCSHDDEGEDVGEGQADLQAPEETNQNLDNSNDDAENVDEKQHEGTEAIEVEPPQDKDTLDDTQEDNITSRDRSSGQQGLGVTAKDGEDAVEHNTGEEVDGARDLEAEQNEGDGESKGNNESATTGGQDSGQQGGSASSAAVSETNPMGKTEHAPNPIKSPGDAKKFWHRKLNVVENQNNEPDTVTTTEESEEKEKQGSDMFEYTRDNQNSVTQTLGEVEQDEAVHLDREEAENGLTQEAINESQDNPVEEKEHPSTSRATDMSSKQPKVRETHTAVQPENYEMERDNDLIDKEDVPQTDDKNDNDCSESEEEESDNDERTQNKVVADLSQLQVRVLDAHNDAKRLEVMEEQQTTGISSSEAGEARQRWSMIQSETHNLARRLCEKLRLVMEPLVASKLRGDYRTGKRINMKRVISYIASGYRKDKIWLRRTKPAKRNYRVLLAVDDSQSMLKGEAGEMALRAMATLATGMSHLEIGEIGIASFGNEMNLVHPFHLPFTAESGANVVNAFKFDQQRTRTALCVESAMLALDTPGDRAALQLVFMISDGRIERDSRSELRKLIREMMERNILLAMIIVEGGDKKKDSILNMKEVTFEKGKPKVKRFMEDYPFPYYIVLDEIHALPEVLGDALRQWFEMLTRLQGNNA